MNIDFKKLKLFIHFVYRGMHVESERSLRELVLSIYDVGSRD